jgi:hypothetical protein
MVGVSLSLGSIAGWGPVATAWIWMKKDGETGVQLRRVTLSLKSDCYQPALPSSSRRTSSRFIQTHLL